VNIIAWLYLFSDDVSSWDYIASKDIMNKFGRMQKEAVVA